MLTVLFVIIVGGFVTIPALLFTFRSARVTLARGSATVDVMPAGRDRIRTTSLDELRGRRARQDIIH